MTKKPVKVKKFNAEQEFAQLVKVMWANDDKLGIRANHNLAAIEKLERRVDNDITGPVAVLSNHVEALIRRVAALEGTPVWDSYNKRQLNPQSEGQFCVIGEKAKHQYPISRTWHTTQEKAEQYAGSLCRNQPSCEELLVVKVVSKVGRKEPDIKITRV